MPSTEENEDLIHFWKIETQVFRNESILLLDCLFPEDHINTEDIISIHVHVNVTISSLHLK